MRHPLRTTGLLLLALAVGCQQAGRYGSARSKSRTNWRGQDRHPCSPHYAWREPIPRHDRPIKFVTAANKKLWDALPELLERTPATLTLLFGQSPGNRHRSFRRP